MSKRRVFWANDMNVLTEEPQPGKQAVGFIDPDKGFKEYGRNNNEVPPVGVDCPLLKKNTKATEREKTLERELTETRETCSLFQERYNKSLEYIKSAEDLIDILYGSLNDQEIFGVRFSTEKLYDLIVKWKKEK